MKMIIALLATLAISAPANAATDKWQPCEYEDGSGQVRCVWDAGSMGNGVGQSFFKNRRGYHDISHARAVRMLAH